MRIIKPKLSIGGENIYSKEELYEYRNSYELYHFFKTGNLFLWLRDNDSNNIYQIEEKNHESYYSLLKMVEEKVNYRAEKKCFDKLYKKVIDLDYQDNTELIEDLERLMTNYEIFLVDKIERTKKYINELKFDFVISLYSVLENNRFKISEKLKGELLYILKNSTYQESDLHLFERKEIIGVEEHAGRVSINETVIITEISGAPVQLSLKDFQVVGEKSYEESKDINLSNHQEVTKKLIKISQVKVVHPSTKISYIEVPKFNE